jgi:tRNA1(Val) A37 N6-methylase TrmN6
MSDRDTLSQWITGAARLLRPGGALTLIWRAADWPEAERTLRNAFGDLVVMPIHSVEGEAAIRMIGRALKGGARARAELTGFVLNHRDRKPTTAAEAVLRHGQPLPFDRQ